MARPPISAPLWSGASTRQSSFPSQASVTRGTSNADKRPRPSVPLLDRYEQLVRRRVRVTADVPVRKVSLGDARCITSAAAQDVLARAGRVPAEGPPLPGPRAELLALDGRLGPGLAAVHRHLD